MLNNQIDNTITSDETEPSQTSTIAIGGINQKLESDAEKTVNKITEAFNKAQESHKNLAQKYKETTPQES